LNGTLNNPAYKKGEDRGEGHERGRAREGRGMNETDNKRRTSGSRLAGGWLAARARTVFAELHPPIGTHNATLSKRKARFKKWFVVTIDS